MERADFDQWKAREVGRLLALVEGERRYYQELVALLPVAVAVVSEQGYAVSANRAFRTLFAMRAEDLGRAHVERLLPGPEFQEKIRDAQTGLISAKRVTPNH